jgi:hypothetical protein
MPVAGDEIRRKLLERRGLPTSGSELIDSKTPVKFAAGPLVPGLFVI